MFTRILLVDDSKSARFAMRKMLENNGYTVDMAANAEEAFGYLNDNQPDVIFMDHFMPGMDGFEAAQVIKSKPTTAGIPIVMCTSKDDPDYIDQARAHGAVDILPKPATENALDAVMNKLASTIELMNSEEPINSPAFDASEVAPDITMDSQGTTTGQGSVPSSPAIPTLSEVVVPRDDVRSIAAEAAAAEIDRILSARVSEVLQSKVPELRESVMKSFDVVVRSLIDKYITDALAAAKEEFSELTVSESNRVAREVSREVMDSSVQANVQSFKEDIQHDLNEQLAEVYSNIGELKANQTLRKASPELMQDMLNQARDVASEQARESLPVAEKTAGETARKVAEESVETALKEFRESLEGQVAKTLKANLETSRKEADEASWRKVTDLQNSLSDRLDKLKGLAGLGVLTGLLAIGGLAYMFMQ